jgi:hypothetical protein
MERQSHDLSNPSVDISADNKVYTMLTTLENVRLQSKGILPVMGPQLAQRTKELQNNARLLCGKLLEVLSNKEKFTHSPEAKLIIRTPPAQQDEDIDIEKAVITIEGNCDEAFGLPDSSIPAMDWHKFTGRTDENTAGQWKRALSMAVSTSVVSKFLNDNYILSYNRKKCFRIFSAKYTQYYNKFAETEVYVVEMLKPRIYGDEKINLSIRALDMALRYRFMFLEQEESRFSPIKFSAMSLDDLKPKVAEMIDELNLLIWQSEEYGLRAPDAIITLLGVSFVPELDKRRQEWEKEKQTLYSAAVELLGVKKLTYDVKSTFVKVVETFCESNRPMSRQYIETVFEHLRKWIDRHFASTSQQINYHTNPLTQLGVPSPLETPLPPT